MAEKKETKTAKEKKGLQIRIKKPDLSKLKDVKYRPILEKVGVALLVVLAFIIVDLGVQYLNNTVSVAVVNGRRVSTREWNKRLQKAYGEAAATQLVEEELIRQEAKKEDVTVSEEDIDADIKEISDSLGGDDMLNDALVANNITMKELREQISLDLLTKKILEPKLEYTDADVKAFFDQYAEVIFAEESAALEEGEKLDYDSHYDETLDVFIDQQIQTERSTWLAEVEGSSVIQNNAIETPKYGILKTTRNIVQNLIDSFNKNETE